MNTNKAQKVLQQIKVNRQALLSQAAGLSEQLQRTKRDVAQNLGQMVERAIQTLKAKGCQVIVAKDAVAAREQVKQILHGQSQVLMSKDPVFDEIGLAHFLRSKQMQPVYTDLGENLAVNQVDVHPRMATINTTIDDAEVVRKIKEDIRQLATQTQYGITGAEAVIAETGTLALLESEGNVRFASNLPYNHIVVVGLEKIVPTLEDALAVCRATSIYGLGKDLLNYISFISGPSRTADIEFRMVQGMHGPKEVYVILLDNGRLAAAQQGELAPLQCLHCGGCLVDCPAYLKDGLRRGYRFTGKRRTVLARFLEEQPAEEPCTLCEGCDKCNSFCPVGISV